ncbi:hypothetical protein [Marinicella rhabdoformis]|uniref:hypothetical protein n=1 Tax=Marinicella rhabdoformis TaxID=2580566 RepID=UPI0012AECEBB|nr:hypothetical protein [Marinicella rhabdoformis]
MNIIQSLEKMGQSSSLKQYPSIKQMLAANDQDEKMMAKAMIHSEEMVCLVAPDDDED